MGSKKVKKNLSVILISAGCFLILLILLNLSPLLLVSVLFVLVGMDNFLLKKRIEDLEKRK